MNSVCMDRPSGQAGWTGVDSMAGRQGQPLLLLPAAVPCQYVMDRPESKRAGLAAASFP